MNPLAILSLIADLYTQNASLQAENEQLKAALNSPSEGEK